MGAGGDLVMSEGCHAVLVLPGVVCFLGPFMRDARVLQSLPGMFLPGEMFLLSATFGCAAVRVSSRFMKLSGFLVIFPVRPVVESFRHRYKLSICPDFVWASLASL